MHLLPSATTRHAVLLVAALCLLCLPAGCGSGGNDSTAVRVGNHSITSGEVEHWISYLKDIGANGHEGPAAPIPPRYTACIAYARTHPGLFVPSTPPIPRQPRAYCEFEYRRFKLKALYLLISYQWVTGEAHELGIRSDKTKLARRLSYYRAALGLTSAAAYKRYLGFAHADTADLLLSLEMEQLVRLVEAKVVGAAKTAAQREAKLARFGKTFKAKWLARTDCHAGYIVPICRRYPPGRKLATFVPPSVPLTDEPSGG
jgi:hypothetical protein